MSSKMKDLYYFFGGEVDSQDILARKRRERAVRNTVKTSFTSVTPLVLVASLVATPVVCSAAQRQPQEKAEQIALEELLNFEPKTEDISLQEQIDSFVFWGRMQQVERNMEAQKLMEEAVKAEEKARIQAENFVSTMQEMTVEGKFSVKLAKISNNLNALSALTECPEEAKKLEDKIASQIKRLKECFSEYPRQYESLKLALKSERKRLKIYQQLRKEYEEALEKRRQEIESVRSFYQSFSRYADVSVRMGISKEHFRQIMYSIPYGNATVFRNNADFLWELSEKYGLNEFLLPGICAWESGWAADPIEANNFSSQRKSDGSYFSYESEAAGIEAVASNLAGNYLPVNGKYYNGKSLMGINILYCQPDPNREWAGGVSDCMKMIAREYLATLE